MQIKAFFDRNTPITQKQCNENVESIAGKPLVATTCQGGCSYYTVEAGQVIVQFCDRYSLLDMNLMKTIEQSYPDFAPRIEDYGAFYTVYVYTMNNIGGMSMCPARGYLQENNYKLLRNAFNSYARFVNTIAFIALVFSVTALQNHIMCI
jgi:hypothetical protein